MHVSLLDNRESNYISSAYTWTYNKQNSGKWNSMINNKLSGTLVIVTN